ncbi:hypothetical protein LENED_008091 [Lentinula edodes]|uniref:DUF6534 domain-containing protein n=1 Tax=Lentinula edodes TaxID=5353 RepID=A0A1Q3EG42_LENED|nr:hypothetical protein LENED_008091 [Lentinula edodes]
MSPTFTETWGCQMIAYMLNAVLYGASLILTLHYFRSYSQIDSGGVQTMIVILRKVQIAQLDDIVVSGILQLLATYLTAFTAQIFFVTRIWALSPPTITRKLMYTGPVLLLAVCQIAFGIAQTILSFRAAKFSLLSSTTRITSTQAGTTAACDILIAVILCMLLHKARSGFQRSDKIIDKLILYTINRGILTSLCALLNLIFFVAIPNTFIFSQLYVISVAAMLLSRKSIRRNNVSDHISTDSDFPLQNINLNTSTTIQMHQETFTVDDQHQAIDKEGQKDCRFTQD